MRNIIVGLIFISALGCSNVRTYNDVPMDGTLPVDQQQTQTQDQELQDPPSHTSWITTISLALGINNGGGQTTNVYNGPHYTSAARPWGLRRPMQNQPQPAPSFQRNRPTPIFSGGRPTLQRQVVRNPGQVVRNPGRSDSGGIRKY